MHNNQLPTKTLVDMMTTIFKLYEYEYFWGNRKKFMSKECSVYQVGFKTLSLNEEDLDIKYFLYYKS